MGTQFVGVYERFVDVRKERALEVTGRSLELQ